jgi:TonB family protein
MKTTILLFMLLVPVALLAQQDEGKKAETQVYTITETMPEFPGGPEGQAQYLMANLRYPEEARNQGITGKSYVSYVVDVDGSVIDARVVRSSHPKLDEEALRVVKGMKYAKPGYQRGKPVRVQFTQPVNFNLPAPVETDKPTGKNKKRKQKNRN